MEHGQALGPIMHEAKFLQGDIPNPNLVHYRECFLQHGKESPGTEIWIVMELCSGGSVEVFNAIACFFIYLEKL